MFTAGWQDSTSPVVPRWMSSTAANDSSRLSSSNGRLDQARDWPTMWSAAKPARLARTASMRARRSSSSESSTWTRAASVVAGEAGRQLAAEPGDQADRQQPVDGVLGGGRAPG